MQSTSTMSPARPAARRAASAAAALLAALALVLVALAAEPALLPSQQSQAQASGVVYSGYSGTCEWEIDSDGLLTIGPVNGKSGELDLSSSPTTGDYCEDIVSIYIEEGVSVQGTEADHLFESLFNLEEADLSNLDVSNVENMQSMFYGCESLKSLDLSGWDVSNVTDMHGMFEYCISLESLDLSGWDVSNVTDMNGMFYECSSLVSIDGISDWDISQVTDMENMFNKCSSLESLVLTSWDTSSLKDEDNVFRSCTSLVYLDISSWDNSSLDKGYETVETYHMFDGDTALRTVIVGENFFFYGITQNVLPVPYDEDFGYGCWRDSEGNVYEDPADIPDYTATTYTAVFDLSSAEVEAARQAYTGEALETDVSVVLGDVELVEGEDYTLEYADNVELGTATVTITGAGSFIGELSATFEIVPYSLVGAQLVLDAYSYECTGEAVEPGVSVTLDGEALVEGEDYTVEYEGNTSGNATVVVTGAGDYAGTLSEGFFIYFSDVPSSASDKWYYDEVYSLSDLGYITGYSDGSFGVGDEMTRAQFITILWRMACPDEYEEAAEEGYAHAYSESGLSDVVPAKYYTEAVNWGVENGIVTGYSNGKFGVNDSMSFQDMCLIIARYVDAKAFNEMSSSTASGVLAEFADGDSVSSYARTGMAWCVESGLVSGNTDGTLAPKSEVARERVATVLYRAIEEGLV